MHSDAYELLLDSSWFDKQYWALGSRLPSMKMALGLTLSNNKPGIIIETGCQRMKDDWGAGCSTSIFAQFCKKFPGYKLVSVDIDPKNVTLATELTADCADVRQVYCMDSVTFLRGFVGASKNKPVAMVYLDSWDYPIAEMCNLYGTFQECQKALDKMMTYGHAAMVTKHYDLLGPSQEHCLKEFHTIEPLITKGVVVMIDDNNLPGWGKGRLVKEELALRSDYELLFDGQQSLWRKIA